MSQYRAVVSPWLHGWEIRIPGVGVTQARDGDDLCATARDYISLMLAIPADGIEVVVDQQ